VPHGVHVVLLAGTLPACLDMAGSY